MKLVCGIITLHVATLTINVTFDSEPNDVFCKRFCRAAHFNDLLHVLRNTRLPCMFAFISVGDYFDLRTSISSSQMMGGSHKAKDVFTPGDPQV